MPGLLGERYGTSCYCRKKERSKYTAENPTSENEEKRKEKRRDTPAELPPREWSFALPSTEIGNVIHNCAHCCTDAVP